MINRLPKDYAVQRPTNGVRPLERSETDGGSVDQPLTKRLLTAAANSVGTHPVLTLGVAFATGILLGKWVKR